MAQYLAAAVSAALAAAADAVLAPLAERAILRILANLTTGTLTLHTPAATHRFPAAASPAAAGPHAELTIRHPHVWLRLAALGDVGLSEGYMAGELECADLPALFALFLANRAVLGPVERAWPARVLGAGRHLVNSLPQARANVAAHYDISNDMFIGFLSRDMTYSCALFRELDADLDRDGGVPRKSNGNRDGDGTRNGDGAHNGDGMSNGVHNCKDAHNADGPHNGNGAHSGNGARVNNGIHASNGNGAPNSSNYVHAGSNGAHGNGIRASNGAHSGNGAHASNGAHQNKTVSNGAGHANGDTSTGTDEEGADTKSGTSSEDAKSDTNSAGEAPDANSEATDANSEATDANSEATDANSEATDTDEPADAKSDKDDADADDDTLYAAQMRKLRYIIRRADIRPGHRVLEIGSGWGALAILIAQTVPGTRVDTLTLSVQQQALARRRVDAAGLGGARADGNGNGHARGKGEDERGSGEGAETAAGAGDDGDAGEEARVRVHLMDYRSMPRAWAGAFDRVVSVEMVEAVGREFLEEYWARIDWALKPDTGVGVVQAITLPEARLETYMREVDFIRKWVLFPGGFLPTLTLLVATLERATRGALVVDHVANIGPHYARTLREWRRRFEARFADVVVPALRREHPGMGAAEIEVFRRKWIYYYCYCEAGFTARRLGDHIVTFVREGNQEYGCRVD